jgi:hypothetical protein
MRTWSWLALTAFVAAALAGCLTGDDDGDTPAAPDGVRAASGRVPVAPEPEMFLATIANDHVTGSVGHVGHQIPELHGGHLNLELLDHTIMDDGLIGPASGFTEVHVVGDLAIVSSLLGSRGLTILNVSDPSDMRVLSHIYNLDDNWDSRISPDGKYVFLGCQGSTAFDCTGLDMSGEQPQVTGGSVCAPLVTCPGSIAVYDITNPTRPQFEAFLPMGFTHNLFVFQHDSGPYAGKYYVMNANSPATVAEWDPTANTFTAASAVIEAVHDVAVQKHPITGEWLLYTGSSRTMAIWNVDDPFAPVLVSLVEGDGIPAMWHEQTPMPCLIAGRHITIGAGESGAGSPQPIAIVDTTDPTRPVVMSEWIIPDHASLTAQQNYRFSLHNIDGNCDGQVAIGMYHAGVWVFDISTPERMAEPATLAYYQPNQRPISLAWNPVMSAPIGGLVTLDVPNVWTAQWSADGGTLFVPDMTTGLYALQPQWMFVEPTA